MGSEERDWGFSTSLVNRPLVLLCDISGSMQPYARIYLRFFSRLGSRAGGGLTAEVFLQGRWAS